MQEAAGQSWVAVEQQRVFELIGTSIGTSDSMEEVVLFGCSRGKLLKFSLKDLVIRSSSSSSSPDSLGNGPAPCLGASLRPVVWLASRESEEASSQVVEPAHSALRSLDLE
ncbi:hypothetical protein FQA47_014430 [Oryzias melastigma]|uniref:Uncharacterized protein n=1 Tax=Oryzias melastigma TaxID=30732 RepID=A0A834CEZ5_ORYME|nr:hypothetical protein FQA47_014430 [Oryzias melastigma]